jgi:hypothetical protein
VPRRTACAPDRIVRQQVAGHRDVVLIDPEQLGEVIAGTSDQMPKVGI